MAVSNKNIVSGSIVKITTVFNPRGMESKVVGRDTLYSNVSYDMFQTLLSKARGKNQGIRSVSKNEFYWTNFSNNTCVFRFVKNK